MGVVGGHSDPDVELRDPCLGAPVFEHPRVPHL